MNAPAPIVITDTSVLINFLVIDRVDLLHRCGHRFLLTDHVVAEVTTHYPDQLRRLEAALDSGMLAQLSVTDPDEINLFNKLTSAGRLGLGECSAIAVAAHRHHILAIDDKRAKKQAISLDSSLIVIGTQELMVIVIRAGIIDVAVADGIKSEWSARHNFTLKIASFAELL
jgi:predicted nucleic acid-binding protein